MKSTAASGIISEMAFGSSSDEEFWHAVENRNPRFDGLFVVGVRSTGIYCRPSCPSRRPKRENVTFFRLPETAERAGFRSCLRCKPNDVVTTDAQVQMVQRVCRIIESNSDAAATLDQLGAQIGVSPFHLQRVFKRLTGVTPRQYAEAGKAAAFRAGVRKSGASVSGAMYDAGYSSSSRLYERASAELGMTPATYRKGGRGMRIIHTIANSALGRLLVAATERGVCAVSLGDSDAKLESALTKEYPEAEIRRDDRALGRVVKQLLAHLAGDRPHLDLTIDVQATAFQRRVWEELQKIPYGSTRSYGEIARAIGRPSAIRAVARACASNRVALVVPCHRVIREDKSLGGYRWGIERKRALLKTEASTPESADQ
jgi:AraC family transcriptional regulator of adaptative response/methylated-DNA-[protein]-cysteine methyltransferase